MIRHPAVADRFYPADPSLLLETLEECTPDLLPKRSAVGLMVPHAGYVYSGRVAGATYAAVDLPKCFIILCPNHTGAGAPLAVVSDGVWETPLGPVPVNSPMARELKRVCPLVVESPDAHRGEHAIEVHLPFLQHLAGTEISIVPVSLGTRRLESLLELGKALARVVEWAREPVLIIASSDMNHFEPAEITVEKDRKALEAMASMDPRQLFSVVHEQGISMCGYGPATSLLEASRLLGATRADLVQYSHSGEINGDDTSVVGYAGVVVG